MIRYFSLGELTADTPVRVGFLAQAPFGEGTPRKVLRKRFMAGASQVAASAQDHPNLPQIFRYASR